MTRLRAWASRLSALFRRHRRDEELEEEIQAHLRMAAQERAESGESAEQARASAVREFGNVLMVKEVTRNMWGFAWLETLMQDFRYGLRMLARSPGFTGIAIITLALGIGANTAVFSVVNGILLQPLPYKDPDRLVMLWEAHRHFGERLAFSYPNFRDFRDQNHAFEEMAAFTLLTLHLAGRSAPEIVSTSWTTGSLFQVAGAEPILGRTFLPEEEKAGQGQVAVISYRLWKRRFGGDPTILGKQVRVTGWDRTVDRTIVGVMPPGFVFPSGEATGFNEQSAWTKKGMGADIWVPLLSFDPKFLAEVAESREFDDLFVVGRLKPGVRLSVAQAEMETIAVRLQQQYPKENEGRDVRLVPLHKQIVGRIRPSLMLLLFAVGFVLLIACANFANLLLTRAASREKEFSVRASVGASRGRLIRQLLSESVLLALLGGGVGVLLAVWGLEALVALAPREVPRLELVQMNGTVLAFSLVVCTLTGLLFGLAPALHASKPDLNECLKEGGRTLAGSRRSHRLRNVLVVTEIGLALVLLVGTGLMIRSFIRRQGFRWGFNSKGLVTMFIIRHGANGEEETRRFIAFERELLRRVEALPGVQSVGIVGRVIHDGGDIGAGYQIEGRNLPPAAQPPRIPFEGVSPSYFRVMEIPLMRGREFTENDTADSPKVVIINEAMARRFFHGEDPIGKRIQESGSGRNPWLTIVGVVADMHFVAFQDSVRPMFYYPYTQAPPDPMTVLVRTSSDPKALAEPLRQAVWSLDQDQPVYQIETMVEQLKGLMAQQRFMMVLLGAFALLSIVLAAVGIYGVISYSVEQRTHEIGVRVALGAGRHDVLRLVVGQGMILTVIGIVAGLAAAFALTRFLASMLFEVRPTDPLTFASASLLLTGVAILACYIPARRAAKVDPMVALRYE